MTMPDDDVFAFPASPGQARLWLGQQLAPDDASYAIPLAMRVRGRLDVDALAAAVEWLGARHEALRTCLSDAAGQLEQLVHDTRRPRLELESLACDASEPELREAALLARCREIVECPFDLAHDLPLRARLLHVDANDHALVLTLHHAAADGWSVRVLASELAHAYAAFAGGRAPDLPEPTLQFADYSEWLRAWLDSEAGEAACARVREQLAVPAPPLELPSEAGLAREDRGHARRGHQRVVDLAATIGPLRALARREALSPFSLLLAAFVTLLQRDTGADDICVGTAFANRERPELAGVVGYLAETLALRMQASPAQPFIALARAIHRQVGEAQASQAVPLERALDARAQLPFEVVFGLDEADAPPHLAGLVCTPLWLTTSTAKFALSVVIELGPADEARALFEADAARMSDLLLARLADRYVELLASSLAAPDTPLGELALLSSARSHELTATLARGATPPLHERGVAARVLAVALPDELPALRHAGTTTTRGELLAHARALAWALDARGVKVGDRVAILLAPGLDLVAAMLALLGCGAAYVPLDPAAPSERWAAIIDEAEPRCVLTATTLRDSAALPSGLQRVDLDQLSLAAAELPSHFPADPSPDALAYVIYTSGSTGRPKGVCVSHRGITSLIDEADYAPALGPDDRIAQVANVAFDAITFEVWAALICGATLVIVERERALDPQAFADTLHDERITVLFLTTALFNLVAALRPAAFAGLRVLLVGGEAFDPRCARAVQAAGAPPWFANIYGPTETTTFATYQRLANPLPSGPVPIGRAIVHASTYVLDPWLRPLDLGLAGELFIGGAGVAAGYFGRPELSAERFLPDPFSPCPGARMYRTGDRVRRNSRGELEFLGRVDHQIKLRGFRIELGEIEAALLTHPRVREAIVGVRTTQGDQRLVAYLALDGASALTLAELRAHLRTQLPDYMLPSALVLQPELPKGRTGKIDRAALAALPLTHGTRALEPARGPTEQVIAEVFAELLGVEQVSRDDDFFALGGHSLLAARLALALGERLARPLPLHVVLRERSVAALATWLASHDAASTPTFTRVPRSAPAQLSFAQQRLWFLHRVAPTSSAYNVPICLALEGPLERHALSRAWAALLERHEILRTRYLEREGEPRQQILAATTPLELVEPPSDVELDAWLAAWASLPFDLERAAPLRARLVTLAVDRHVLALVVHHIAIDGWSAGRLLVELGQHLRAELGLGPQPEPTPLQYVDYAHWQQQRASSGALSDSIAWWQRALADGPELLALPLDRPRPPRRDGRGSVESLRLTTARSRQLAELAARHGVTTFMVLVAATWAWLARVCGERDIVIGTPIAGRDAAGCERAQGCFVNTLALRGRVDEREPFVRLLGQAQDTCMAALAHAEPPFDLVVDALRPRRSSQHTPIFQVMLTYTPHQPEPDPFEPLRSRSLALPGTSSAFDLSLALADDVQGTRVELEYALDVLDPASAEALLRGFERLLAGIVDTPERTLALLPLALPAPAQPLPATPSDVLVRIARALRERADHPFVIDGGELLDGRTLARRVVALATLLRERGVVRGEVVALALPRSPEAVVALLALLELGCVYLPLDVHAPPSYLATLVGAAGARRLLTTSLTLAQLECIDPRMRVPEPSEVDVDAWLAAPSQHALALPAALMFTSGSTGAARGVWLTRAALAHFCTAALATYRIAPGDRVLHFANLAFDTSLEELLTTLAAGATLLVRGHALPSPRELLDQVATLAINVLDLPTAYWSELVAHLDVERAPLPASLHTLILGGSALAPSELARWQDGPGKHLRLLNTYGPTEATIVALSSEVGQHEGPTSLVPIGEPWPHVRAYVLDPDGQLVPPGLAGELWLGGEALALGYLGRPADTAARFLPDPFSERSGARMYRTGDRVTWRAGLGLVFLGRVDDQLKIRGHRVEPRQVELAFAELPGVDTCAVVPRSIGGETRLVAFYTRAPEQPEVDIRALARVLPAYMLPALALRLDQLPLTPRGKPDRAALAAHPLEAITPRASSPTSALDQLTALFGELLGHPIDADDDFFTSGGHSLLALRLLAAIEQVRGIRVPPAELLHAASPRALARRLDELAAAPRDHDEVLTTLRSGSEPVLVLIHPVGGQLLCYRPLLDALSSEHACVGIAAAPADAEQSLPALATRYVDALQQALPGKPLVLIGWSMGGVLAYEMARRLRARGEPVAKLIAIDAMPFAADEDNHDDDATLDAEALARAAVEGFDFDMHAPAELLAGYRRNHRALLGYRAPPSDETLVLFAATDNPGLPPGELARRWQPLAAGGLQVHACVGNHDTLLRPPLVESLAAAIREHLSALETPP
jgi:amino acid adenylation domain-containing protein